MNNLTPFKLLIILLSIIIILDLFYVYSFFQDDAFLHSNLFKLIDLDSERNIPSNFSSFIILLCSVQLMLISNIKKTFNRYSLPWAFLALVFLFLSIDEKFSIHERFNNNLWALPYAIAVIVFLILFFILKVKLPQKTFVFTLISGTIYILGVLVINHFGLNIQDSFGVYSMKYRLVTFIEENLELLGISLFNYTLFFHINYVKSQENEY